MQVVDITTSDRWRIGRLRERWESLRDASAWERRSAFEDWRDACDEMTAGLARRRGWIVARRPFTVGMLLRASNQSMRRETPGSLRADETRYIDHPEYLRWPTRPYRPAAILTHSYAAVEHIQAFADERGLACELLPWSWYYPGRCTAALLTPATRNDNPRPAA